MQPIVGEWYLSVKCDRCSCTILIFHDLNHGEGKLNGEYLIRCPRCTTTAVQAVNHYQHRAGKKPDISIEII